MTYDELIAWTTLDDDHVPTAQELYDAVTDARDEGLVSDETRVRLEAEVLARHPDLAASFRRAEERITALLAAG